MCTEQANYWEWLEMDLKFRISTRKMWEIAIFHKEKGDTAPILRHLRYTRFLVFWPTWCVLCRPSIENVRNEPQIPNQHQKNVGNSYFSQRKGDTTPHFTPSEIYTIFSILTNLVCTVQAYYWEWLEMNLKFRISTRKMWEIAIFHKEKGDTAPILRHLRYTRFLVFWPTWRVLCRPNTENGWKWTSNSESAPEKCGK